MDDRELLQQFVSERSATAFAQLVERNAGIVYAAARRQVGDTHLAEDLTQAVFILLARKADKIRGTVAGWLIVATYYAARNARKMAARRAYHEGLAGMKKLQDSVEDFQGAREIEWENYAPLVDAAMARLGSGDRDAVALRYLRELSLRDVGALLGISEEAARKRVDRAMDRLRKLLKAGTATPASAMLALHMAAKGTEAAPAKLVESISASIATSAKGSMASALATKTAHAMTLVKIKIAAVILVTVALTGAGTGTVIKLRMDGGSGTSIPTGQGFVPAIKPMAEPGTSAAPALPVEMPESQIAGELQLARWDVILSENGFNAIRAKGTIQRTASKNYQAYVFDTWELRNAVAGTVAGGDVVRSSKNLEFARSYGSDVLQFSFGNGINLAGEQDKSPVAIEMSSMGTKNIFQRNADGMRIKLDHAGLQIQMAFTDGLGNVQYRNVRQPSAIEFDGTLTPGQTLAMIGRFPAGGGKVYYHLLAWEPFKLQAGHVLFHQRSCLWWVQHGPAMMRKWSDIAYVYSSRATPDETPPGPPTH